MLRYLDGVAARPLHAHTFTQSQALWQETADSVVIGTLRNSSLLMDEQRSALNQLLAQEVRAGRWAHLNLLEVNNVCDGGAELMAAIRGRYDGRSGPVGDAAVEQVAATEHDEQAHEPMRTLRLLPPYPTPLPPRCSLDPSVHAAQPESTVLHISDGLHTRCLAVVIPSGVPKPMPVLLDFHGAGGNARRYGGRTDALGTTLADLAAKHGFGVVGGEALQFGPASGEEKEEAEEEVDAGAEGLGGWEGGQWLLPEKQTDASGLLCKESGSPDHSYIASALAALSAYDDTRTFNTSAVFITGCSMGSAMAMWIAQCLHREMPVHVSAFASQSTGLKIKGDTLTFPPDNYQPQYGWGECPGCQYFPAPVVRTRGLKACIVDQYEDVTSFYRSSLQLNATWRDAGMRAEISLHAGAHCQTHSFAWIVRCLDDGTGWLMRL